MNSKKIILLVSAIFFTAFAFAQKSNIRKANSALDKAVEAQKAKKTQDATVALKDAKAAIDLAVADEATSDDSKAWYSKANIYFTLQNNKNFSPADPYKEGIIALQKSFSLDSKLEVDPQTTPLLVKGGFFAFNAGVNEYNDSKFTDAYKDFNTTLELLGKKKDKRFILYVHVDTIRAQAKMLLGYSAYYSDKNSEAITLLNEAKENEFLPNQPNIYLILAQAYAKAGDTSSEFKIIEEGKTKYPDNANLTNQELNYYLTSGNKEEMVSKLEDAAADDPTNASLPFNLGILYDQLAHPKDGSIPTKAKEYEQDAITSYQKALNLEPNNGTYNYQFGAFYFNLAVAANKKLSDLEINENAKHQALTTERDGYFERALPLLEKSKTIFSTNFDSLSPKEKGFYVQNLQALSKIYAIQNKLDKVKEIMVTLKTLEK